MKNKNCYSFFSNKECEYFPCHKTDNEDDFNCIFCYCPLYALGENCGGNFNYTDSGIKDCSNCIIPHSKKGYNYVTSHFPQIAKLAKKEN